MSALLEDGGAPFTSAEGTVRSFQRGLPRGEEEGDKPAWISYVSTGDGLFSRPREIAVFSPCLKRRVCFAVLLCNQRCSPPHLHHPTPPQLSVDSHTSVSHTHAHTHTSRKHAHWAISLGSLTRGCLLLRDEFS